MSNPDTKVTRRSPVIRQWAKLRLMLRRSGVGAKLEIGLAILAVASGAGTYIALSRENMAARPGDGLVAALLLVNLVLLVTLATLVARRVVSVWLARREGSAGSNLHLRLVGLFALVAAVPSVIMAVLSALFLQYGVQNWFSETVREALNNSLEVAEAYIEEHRKNIKLDLVAMANDLNRAAGEAERDKDYLDGLVESQAIFRALQEAIVFDSNGRILAKYSLDLDLSANRVPNTVMQRVQGGEVVVVSNPGDDQVRALTKLDGFFDAFLYISRGVDPRVTAHVEAARRAVETYHNLEGQRSSVQLRSNAIFIVLALVMLLVAIWLALWFSNRLVAPISRLVSAANRIRQGDLTARADGPAGPDELGVLSRTFNRMTRQLEAQRRELVSTNRELDERRRFLEAVLEGVSAGVLGVTPEGCIHVPNRSACDLLGLGADQMVGCRLAEIAPQMGRLLDEAAHSPEKTAQAQVAVERRDQMRNLLVRVAAETDGASLAGFVVTFDDITQQLRDQRTAAWADVARRIAHEIKNPLTPIQLSAERLRRKYQKELADPGIFVACTDTIIRQVGDLRQMVDEFSAFARMPAPIFEPRRLGELVREAVYLQELADSNIKFSFDLPAEDIEIVCDSRLIAQALTNLVKNAAESIDARHSRDGGDAGNISLRLRGFGDRVEIAVEDSGIGLPEDAERLVEPYVTTRAKGTGLGLAIVRRVAEEHGGRIVLENRAEGGARIVMCIFYAQLDKKVAAARSRRAAERPEAAE